MDSKEPPPSTMIGLLVLSVVLIILSMIFSASESAFLSVNKLRLRFLRNQKNKKAIRVGKLLDNKEKLINSILVGNNLVNIGLSAVITSLALEIFGNSGIGYATAVVTIFLLIFGEIAPKTFGSHHPEGVAFTFAPFIESVTVLLTPFVFVFTNISRILAKIFGINYSQKKVSFTEEEIKQFIQVGEEEGVLESGEKTMMHRVFKFTDLSARDIMIPRTKITAIQIKATYNSIIELSQKSHLSRFPVYDKDLDDIKGVLYMKDVLFSYKKEEDFEIKKIMRPPLYVLDNKKMSSIQQILDDNKESMAIVLDEYSGTAGLLTKEDIAEEIFGNIYDEYDATDIPEIDKKSATEAILSGSARLIDVSELLGIKLQSDNFETINGFLTEKFDGFPCVGTEIIIDNYVFKILDSTDRKINKVNVKKQGAIYDSNL